MQLLQDPLGALLWQAILKAVSHDESLMREC
jgi:hypothetical protein